MEKINEYKDYVGYVGLSGFVEQNQTFFQKKPWVPNWFWRLWADEVITPLQISQELRRAGKQGLRDLVNEQYVLSFGECDLRPFIKR